MSQKKLINSLPITLRWLDLDAYGHVGNSRIYDFMTDARVAALGEEMVLSDLQQQFVIVESGCKFKASLYYPGTVIVKQYSEKVGNSSFTLSYEFTMENNPELICAEGFVVMVCYDAKLKQAVRVPDLIRNLFT